MWLISLVSLVQLWRFTISKSVIMGTARLNDNLQTLTENDRGKGIVDAESQWHAQPTYQSTKLKANTNTATETTQHTRTLMDVLLK